jgi:hypothetical protein
MPMVENMLREMSGLEPDHTVNPDEAVARGAALYAGYLLAKEVCASHETNIQITNVNSHSLGVEGIDPETMRKRNVVLIPRNTPLPAKATERFTTKSEGQRSIVLNVIEGESTFPSECTSIGRTSIRNLPAGLTKGWPIDVTFEYGSNGRLSVHAVVPGTNHEATLDLERAVGMSHEGIEQWKKPVSTAAGFDSFESMVENVLGVIAPFDKNAKSSEGVISAPEGEAQRREGEAPAEPKERASLSGRSSARQEPRPPETENPFQAATLTASPADSFIPQRKPGDSALRTFAAKPQKLEEVTPIWEEEENIPLDKTMEFVPEKQNGRPPSGRMSASRLLFNVIGFLVFSAFGLAIGYIILHYIQPDKFKWPW